MAYGIVVSANPVNKVDALGEFELIGTLNTIFLSNIINLIPRPMTGITVCSCPAPSSIVSAARALVTSNDYMQSAVHGIYQAGTNKCNILVYDALVLAHASITLTNRSMTSGNKYPPGAADWADQNYEIPCWVIASGAAAGDVASDGVHVGIVTEPGRLTVWAPTNRPVVENDWGFRAGQHPTFRRCVKKYGY